MNFRFLLQFNYLLLIYRSNDLLVFLGCHYLLRLELSLLELLFNHHLIILNIFQYGLVHIQIDFIDRIRHIDFIYLNWALFRVFVLFSMQRLFLNNLHLFISIFIFLMSVAWPSVFAVFTLAEARYTWQPSLKALTISLLAFRLLAPAAS